MTQLDNFRKFMVTNFIIKVAKIFGDFWATLKSTFSSTNGYFLFQPVWPDGKSIR